MRAPFSRAEPLPTEVRRRAALARGDKVLAQAVTEDGVWLLGTRDALVAVPPLDAPERIPWHHVATAEWDRDESRLRVVEVADFGLAQSVRTFTVPEPGRLLAMVRERVTASVVLQRRVPVTGRLGVLVVARRSPSRRGELTWSVDLDPGLDPDDPLVRAAAEAGLDSAQEELGGAGQPGERGPASPC